MSELLHVLTDPAHILAEIVMELTSYLVFGVIFAKWVLRRHDRKVHDNPVWFYCPQCGSYSGQPHRHPYQHEEKRHLNCDDDLDGGH